MFKKIQNYLLINHPLWWNTKVIPTSIILIIINLVFLISGYYEGKLDFTETDMDYNYGNDATITFFCVLLSILSLIVWLVFYLKNNSFKSLYPKTNLSLFKEWLLLLFICLQISLFTTSFYLGKDIRVRSYYPENEAKKRCETLSKASFFVDGSYSQNFKDADGYGSMDIAVEAPIDSVEQNYILYKGKKYDSFSLLNKNLNSYTFFNYDTDSIHKVQLKDWLVNQQKDSLQKLFKNYLLIAQEHHLKANIDAKKWLDLINDYPDFKNYKLIGNTGNPEPYYIDNYGKNQHQFDSVNKFVKIIQGEKFECYKYYVPENNLKYNYDKIADSWNNPTTNWFTLLISLYFGVFLSLVIFGFRVTSGRNWLIALISIGIVAIVFGLITVVISSDYTFAILTLMTILFAFFFFIMILMRKKNKSLSGIMINGFLWLFPTTLPIIYYLTLEYLKDINYNATIEYNKSSYYPTIKFMEDNTIYLFYGNLVFIILMMVFLSVKIKKWKGIAES